MIERGTLKDSIIPLVQRPTKESIWMESYKETLKMIRERQDEFSTNDVWLAEGWLRDIHCEILSFKNNIKVLCDQFVDKPDSKFLE